MIYNAVCALCRSIKKAFRWSAEAAEWNRVCKRSTVRVYDGGDKRKWVAIKDGQERVRHAVPNGNVAGFKKNEERLSCQWTGSNDAVSKGDVMVIIYFHDRRVFGRFVSLFEEAMAVDIK